MAQKTDIRDLQENMGNLTIIARVEEKSQEVLKDGKIATYAIIADETGSIKLNLQGDQIEQVKLGQTIRVSGVFTEVNKGFLEISSWTDIKLVKEDRIF